MEAAASDVVEVQIPALRQLCEAGSLHVDNIDVFCERGVFDRDSTARILRAGQEAGWKINFHGDELNPMEAGLVKDVISLSCMQIFYHTSTSKDYVTFVMSSTS